MRRPEMANDAGRQQRNSWSDEVARSPRASVGSSPSSLPLLRALDQRGHHGQRHLVRQAALAADRVVMRKTRLWLMGGLLSRASSRLSSA